MSKELVGRLRYGALCPVSGDGDSDKLVAATVIERLEAENAALQAEVDSLKSEVQLLRDIKRKWEKLSEAVQKPLLETVEQLAASQAREQQLREALMKAAVHVMPTCDELYYEFKAVLMPPPDTTALEACVKRAGEVMRERCAVEAYEWAMAYVVEDTAPISNDEAIRTLPGVTLEDLK